MKHVFLIAALLFSFQVGQTQNCNAFKYKGDTLQYQACIIAEEAENHYQFSKKYQEIYDKAIAKCPYFAVAYQAKSVAYLKSGDLVRWKELIDEAVRLDPKEYLGYRGWCRYQFFRDYRGTIEDIERLDELVNYDIGYSTNGDYHLNTAKALCYRKIGEKAKAIQIIEQQLQKENNAIGVYAHLHLGVLYLETGNYEKAIELLNIQEKENNLAENQYYAAMAKKELGRLEECTEHLTVARQLYKRGLKISDGDYDHPMDKVYLSQIEEALENLDKTTH